jgi:hypothetical protein
LDLIDPIEFVQGSVTSPVRSLSSVSDPLQIFEHKAGCLKVLVQSSSSLWWAGSSFSLPPFSLAEQKPFPGRIIRVTTRKCAICPVREAAAMRARSVIRAFELKTIFKQKGSVSRSKSDNKADALHREATTRCLSAVFPLAKWLLESSMSTKQPNSGSMDQWA